MMRAHPSDRHRAVGRGRPRPLLALGVALLAGGGGDGAAPSGPPAGGAPVTVAVVPGTLTVVQGRSGALAADVRDARGIALGGSGVRWSSSDAQVATVDDGGVVRALRPGAIVVRAEIGGASDSARVTVERAPLTSLTIAAAGDRIVVGERLPMRAVALDDRGESADDRALRWSTTDASRARVGADGVVEALAPGAVAVVAEVDDRRAELPLTVVPVPVARVAVTPAAAALTVGDSLSLAHVATGARGDTLRGRSVAWQSSDPRIVAVSADGRAVALAAGAATVTATVEGIAGSAAIAVTPPPVAAVSLVAPATLLVGQTTPLTAVVRDARGAVLAGRAVAWASASPGVLAVTAGGAANALAEGAAVVSAVVEGVRASASITVLPRGLRALADRPDDFLGPQVHVLYLVPADGVDLGLDSVPTLATSLASAQNWLAARTEGRRLRLDTYEGRLDVSFVRLRRTGAQLRAFSLGMHDSVAAEVRARGFDRADRIYLAYYEGTHVYACGLSHWPPLVPGRLSTLFLEGVHDTPQRCGDRRFATAAGAPAGYLEFAALHEILHALGIVGERAPDYAAWAHVGNDPRDLMYTGPLPWTPAVVDAARRNYFNPAGLPAGQPNLATSPYVTRPAASPLAPLPERAQEEREYQQPDAHVPRPVLLEPQRPPEEEDRHDQQGELGDGQPVHVGSPRRAASSAGTSTTIRSRAVE
ncbi:Ig-like domain-containing protein [Roseisolibacter sp. H3M3-2]|uniref:Ig-like domain-containing protein n=1 Tax=Roseisolibacter sp. H3M3-2 TaxID=3031323 RepID=UPI0023DC4336|nr:Ig-like domain-containing protein [Roseisolibacter sp. H3M3-2]MDF1502180.1 Ig-like domain-containing protein [Roseisolibacter sp. H3M3-2]